MKDNILKYGIRNGIEFHISEVENGLKCNCICPACGEILVAKKGKSIKPQDHFAHKSKIQCEHAYETSLHYDAKRIFERRREISLPSRKAIFDTLNLNNFYEKSFNRKHFGKITPQKFQIESVQIEKRLHDIIPDIKCTIGQKPLLIEIAVTSKIKNEKLEKIQKIGIPVIEIDLSKLNRTIEEKDLEVNIIDNIENKFWVNNLKDDKLIEELNYKQEQIKNEIFNLLENKLIKGTISNPFVNDCPKILDRIRNKRIELYECKKCSFNLATHEYNILCGFRNYIKIKDIIEQINEKPALSVL